MSTPIEEVRRFWDAHPLWTGESKNVAGERSFFDEHEQVALYEHSGKLDPIFTRDLEPQKKVLDVGCGIGFWVKQFSALGVQMYACDLSEAAVQLTRRRLSLYGLHAEVRQGNAEELPYADGTFDHVNCQGVIHHTPNTGKCIEEFARVLKPGGTVCFSVYYKPIVLRSRPLFRLVTMIMRPFVRLPGRGREGMLAANHPDELVRLYDGVDNPIGKSYTSAGLRALTPTTLDVLEEKRFGFPRRVFPFSIPTLLHRFLSVRFGLMLALRCRKVDRAGAPQSERARQHAVNES